MRSRPVSLLRHLAGNEPQPLQRWLQASPPSIADAEWLLNQLLAPFAYHQLRRFQALLLLDPPVRDLLERAARSMSLHEALVATACQQVLAGLAARGITAVVMKGWALATLAYPTPRCRPMGDLDLWVRDDERQEAIATLAALGYDASEKGDRPAELVWEMEGEVQMRGPNPARLLVELQWPAFRGEWVRRATRIDHEGVWQRRQGITVDGIPISVMTPEDAILLLALHQAINHHFTYPCWLRTQVDIHQLCQGQVEWPGLVARARAWGIATVAWLSLSLAATLLDSPIPVETLAALAPPAWQQKALARFEVEKSVVEMRPSSYDRRRLLLQLLLADSPRAIATLAYRAIIPEREWLMLRYNLSNRRELPRARLRHLSSLILRARV